MKNKQLKKTLTYIGKLFSSALLIILILVGLFLGYYLISARMVAKNPNYEPKLTLYTIVSGSMEPNIRVYDVILDTRVDRPEQLKVGDVITFKSTSNISRGLIVTHRIIDTRIVNGKVEYVTKGDWNPTADGDTAKFDNIIGKVAMRFPQLGRLQFFLATKMGWFIVVLLPASCVIIYDIIKLVKLISLKKESESIDKNDNKLNIDSQKDKIVSETLENIKKSDYISRLNGLKDFENNNGQ